MNDDSGSGHSLSIFSRALNFAFLVASRHSL